MRYCYSIKVLNKCGDEVVSDFYNTSNKRHRDGSFKRLVAWYKKRFPSHKIVAEKL